jgi:hypothetical protein
MDYGSTYFPYSRLTKRTGAEFANTESNMKNVKIRFRCADPEAEGVRRPFERSENYVPPTIFAKAQRNRFFLFAKTLRPGKGLS